MGCHGLRGDGLLKRSWLLAQRSEQGAEGGEVERDGRATGRLAGGHKVAGPLETFRQKRGRTWSGRNRLVGQCIDERVGAGVAVDVVELRREATEFVVLHGFEFGPGEFVLVGTRIELVGHPFEGFDSRLVHRLVVFALVEVIGLGLEELVTVLPGEALDGVLGVLRTEGEVLALRDGVDDFWPDRGQDRAIVGFERVGLADDLNEFRSLQFGHVAPGLLLVLASVGEEVVARHVGTPHSEVRLVIAHILDIGDDAGKHDAIRASTAWGDEELRRLVPIARLDDVVSVCEVVWNHALGRLAGTAAFEVVTLVRTVVGFTHWL